MHVHTIESRPEFCQTPAAALQKLKLVMDSAIAPPLQRA